MQHEFSTIPGVKEDVTEIVLNVKNLLTKLHLSLIHILDIVICTTAQTDEEARELLTLVGAPFER